MPKLKVIHRGEDVSDRVVSAQTSKGVDSSSDHAVVILKEHSTEAAYSTELEIWSDGVMVFKSPEPLSRPLGMVHSILRVRELLLDGDWMMEQAVKGRDVYMVIAADIAGIEYSEVHIDQREWVKVTGFHVMYGM